FSRAPTALALAITNAAVAVLGMSLACAFADRRLREKDAQLTTALNNMAQGLVMFDSQKRLIVHNSRYIEMYGPSPEIVKSGCTKKDLLHPRQSRLRKHVGVPRTEILGKTAFDIFPQSSADEINDGDEQLLKGSDPLYFNEHAIEMPRRGVRFVTAKRFVVRSTDYANQYLVGVVEDVTERKLSEERLRQAQKMETRTGARFQ